MPAAEPGAAAAARRVGLACLLVTCFGWGLNWPAMKLLLAQLPPLFARGCAGVAAGLVLGLAAAVLGQPLRVPREARGRLLAAAFFNVFAWMGCSTLSLRWLPVGPAALLVYTLPVWAMLFAWPLLGQRPSPRALAGLLLCGWRAVAAVRRAAGPGRRRQRPARRASRWRWRRRAVRLRHRRPAAAGRHRAAGAGGLAGAARLRADGGARPAVRAARPRPRRPPRLGADGLHDAGADGPVLPDLVRRAAPPAARAGVDGDAAHPGDRRRRGGVRARRAVRREGRPARWR